jgi:hypothetical protein
MKVTAAVALIAFVAAGFGGTAAAPCNTMALSKLLVTANVRTCGWQSGYNPTSMTIPSDAQIAAMCNSDECTQVIRAVKQAAPNECTIGPLQLYATVVDPVTRRCGDKTGGSASASGSNSGPAAGDAGSTSGSVAANATAGSAAKAPATSAPRSTTRPPSTTAPANGGADVPTLSSCAAVAVLATVIAAVL